MLCVGATCKAATQRPNTWFLYFLFVRVKRASFVFSGLDSDRN
jgi:hypothetical protein